MGFPGEEALNPGGGRYGKKVYCEGGSFVGAAGEVKVRASGGAWSTEPSGPGSAEMLQGGSAGAGRAACLESLA